MTTPQPLDSNPSSNPIQQYVAGHEQQIEVLMEALKPFALVDLTALVGIDCPFPCFSEASVILAQQAYVKTLQFMKDKGVMNAEKFNVPGRHAGHG